MEDNINDNDIMSNGISDTDIYKLMNILSINDASALIAGISPNDIFYDDDNQGYGNRGHEEARYRVKYDIKNKNDNTDLAFDVSIKSLTYAVVNGDIQANIVINPSTTLLSKMDLDKDWIAINGIDGDKTTVKRDDLKSWLDKRGVYPPLLFPNGKKDDYMNPKHLHYSPKLAVCIRAWEVAQTADIQGKTVRQYMSKWIKGNGEAFGLSNNSEKMFDELATISNWDTKGGRGKSQATPPLKDDDKEVTAHQKIEIILPDFPLIKDPKDIPF